MKHDVQKRIEETLNSLDGMQRAEANPFLYGKIRNRSQEVNEYIPKRSAWTMVMALCIVAVVNVFSVLHFSSQKQKTDGAEVVAKEYSISLPQSY